MKEGQRGEKIHREGRKSVGAVERRGGRRWGICVWVFYTFARVRVEVSGRGDGPRLIQFTHE